MRFRGTKKEAQDYAARKRIELGATGVVQQKNAPAFETFCVDVCKPHAKLALRATTWNVRRYQLAALIEFFKLTKLTKITTALVESFKQQRVKDVDKVTVNSELNVLSAVVTYARHLKLPCASPTIKRFTVRKKKGSAKAYTREEVGYILAGAKAIGDDFHAPVKFIAETGARRSEAINLP